MDRLVDLDAVAAELQARRARWAGRGLQVGAFTWRDAQSTWPQPIVSDRAQVADPESLGVIMTVSPSHFAELVLWRGGWADLDYVIDRQVVSEKPKYSHLRECIAVAEHVADQLLSDKPVDPGADAVTLWRPTGPEELALVKASGWRQWPPRLPGQPIFYPVLNEDYATKIARDWNVRHSGSGYVTRFRVLRSFLDRYQTHQVGGRTIMEYWIPAEDLAELNANIVGLIELVAEYHRDEPPPRQQGKTT